MTTDTALIEKREELKRRLTAGEYRTLIDVLLDGTSRIIQRITRNTRKVSPWTSSVILYLIVLLVGFAVLMLVGDISILIKESPIVFIGIFLVNLSFGYLSIPAIVVGNFYIHHVFTTFHNSVLDAVESIDDLDGFESWLNEVCNRKIHFFMSIVGGIPVGIFLINTYANRGINPWTITVTILLLGIGNFIFLYFLLYMVLLSARIGRYQLALYRASPASSEVIGRLANLLSKFVYLVAIYAAYLALVFALSGLFIIPVVTVFVILLFWIPIIAMFFLNQNSLSSVIQKAKWKTLNEIQARVEKLHTSKKFGEKDTMETINRLMDYYDRIKSSSGSTIDLRAVLNLINSLLFPLLALVLANIDKILDLFR